MRAAAFAAIFEKLVTISSRSNDTGNLNVVTKRRRTDLRNGRLACNDGSPEFGQHGMKLGDYSTSRRPAAVGVEFDPRDSKRKHVDRQRRHPATLYRVWLCVICSAVVFAGGFAQAITYADERSSAVPKRYPLRCETRSLPNVVQVHDDVYSGGMPAGEDAFLELVSLGVKTIVSVDGLKPDVDTARDHGLKTVHLPQGYDGISPDQTDALAKAVRVLEKPIYFHCHHGKHRSPAAASVGCVSNGLMTADDVPKVLQLAGTGLQYRGLHRDATRARRIHPDVLDRLNIVFRETAEVRPIAEAMVAIDETFEAIEVAASAERLSRQEDVFPADVLTLQEHFTELLRTEEMAAQPQRFRDMLKASEATSRELHQLLESAATNRERSKRTEPKKLVEQIRHQCTTCHRSFRDNLDLE